MTASRNDAWCRRCLTGRYSDRLRVTIDDSPICCEAPRQALERPQNAIWPVQGLAGVESLASGCGPKPPGGLERISSVDGHGRRRQPGGPGASRF
jgi:hypothetical protein